MATTAIVIDDDHDLSEIFSKLLELHKIKIIGIGYNGRDAIRLVKGKKPRIVFLDINMPEINGVEALKEIKKISSETHVIMITADHLVNRKNFLECGATEVLLKPFDLQKIMQIVDKINFSR